MRDRRVLHILSQRPALTGSGITLEALVGQAARAGWDQQVVVGVPVDAVPAAVGGLGPQALHAVTFAGKSSQTAALHFAVPGMSDVMPYTSSRFCAMTQRQLEAYRRVWRLRLREVVGSFRPELIHAHHAWIVGAMLKDLAPDIPVVIHCHGTCLRQMALCPHLAGEVRDGCRRNDAFVVLHADHAAAYTRELGLDERRVHVVGAGYRDDIFHFEAGARRRSGSILYAGKFSESKGLACLLDAVELLCGDSPGLVLHVAGDGRGEEAEALRARMAAMGGSVVLHGLLDQPALAELMRRCAVLVLPSFYEGLPLVLVEAFASGCRLVSTDLPGIREVFGPGLGEALELVAAPRLETVDQPRREDLPAFVRGLAAAIRRATEAPPLDLGGTAARQRLRPFGWRAVFERVEALWTELVEAR
ncbi:MAG: glycosyltransferase family 4 protein [Candidatus Binatia bacterium]